MTRRFLRRDDVMRLWFVMHDSDGDSLDLFVRATSEASAVDCWRAYYLQKPDVSPWKVVEVPKVAGPAGAIDWGELLDTATHDISERP